jgi:hypothetical protein
MEITARGLMQNLIPAGAALYCGNSVGAGWFTEPPFPPPQETQNNTGATVNQHPPVHHPLDASYYSVVDEPQLSLYLVSPW